MNISKDIIISDLPLSQRRKIVSLLLDFCKQTLGYKHKKSKLKVSVLNTDSSMFGCYTVSENKIMINTFECETLDMVARTFIHEYTHFLQDLRSYTKLYKKHGYGEHPQEIEACENELKYERRALSYLKKHLIL